MSPKALTMIMDSMTEGWCVDTTRALKLWDFVSQLVYETPTCEGNHLYTVSADWSSLIAFCLREVSPYRDLPYIKIICSFHGQSWRICLDYNYEPINVDPRLTVSNMNTDMLKNGFGSRIFSVLMLPSGMSTCLWFVWSDVFSENLVACFLCDVINICMLDGWMVGLSTRQKS